MSTHRYHRPGSQVIEVEACQFNGELRPPLPLWARMVISLQPDQRKNGTGSVWVVDTPEGKVRLSKGNWLIREPDGGVKVYEDWAFQLHFKEL